MPDLFSQFDAGQTDTEGRLLPDVCRNKHGGNPASVEAFAKVQPHIRESHLDILAWLDERRTGTLKEYCAVRGLHPNQVSGRFSELKKDQRIIDTGERRDGATVYRRA